MWRNVYENKYFIDIKIAWFRLFNVVFVSFVALSKIKQSYVVCLEMQFHVLVTRFEFHVFNKETGHELVMH